VVREGTRSDDVVKRVLIAALVLVSCRHRQPVTEMTTRAWRVARPEGSGLYRFTSTQRSPSGTSSVRLTFRLDHTKGVEIATIVGYESATDTLPFARATLDAACVRTLGAPAGALAVLPITPPPADLRALIDGCVPDDFFGAATDILSLLMVQMQPKFRAAELPRAGARLRVDGYVARWTRPSRTLDARIVSDSGFVRLDSLGPRRALLTWDTSPMAVDLVVQIAPMQRALLRGHEWFTARVAFDPRDGRLLEAWTEVDSLVLPMHLPYAAAVVPAAGVPLSPPISTVRIVRHLRLEPISPFPVPSSPF
jgi:hypothetical protein